MNTEMKQSERFDERLARSVCTLRARGICDSRLMQHG